MRRIEPIDFYSDCDDIMFPDRPLVRESDSKIDFNCYQMFVIGVEKYNRCSVMTSGRKYGN